MAVNDLIRKANEPVELTKEQILEIARIYKRPNGIFRFTHYVDINTKDGPINFGKVIKPFQYDMIKLFHDNEKSILLASRQMSKCVCGDTKIKVKNNENNKEFEITIEKFHKLLKKERSNAENILPSLETIEGDSKFIETLKVNGYSVKTDEGYKNVISTNKTVKFDVYYLKTENYELKCADTHVVYDDKLNEKYVKDLNIGEYIVTESGVEKIIEIIKTNEKEHMYDLSVDSDTHRYYTNGILSHNTTTAAFYILYESCFPRVKGDYLIVAHRLDHAQEVLRRIKEMYYSLPKWLKPGVEVFNKTSITFDNGVRIIAEPTTENAGRGKSLKIVYCVTGETKVKIRNKKTGEIREVSIKELYENDEFK